MRFVAVLLGVFAVGLVVATFRLARDQAALDERLRTLEAARAAPRAAPEAAEGEPTSADRPALDGREGTEEAAPLREAVADLADRVARQEARVQEVARVVVEGSAPSLGRPEFEDAVRDVVGRLLADTSFRPKVAAAAKAGEVPKKPHLDVLAKALALDDAQKRRFREDLQDVQGQLLTVLSEPAADGGATWLERIAAVEQQPEGDPRRAQVFVELLKAKVPGGEQTFLERAVELATEFRRRTGEYLRPDQSESFARMDVDLFGVKMD
jgi:hypothetical protein